MRNVEHDAWAAAVTAELAELQRSNAELNAKLVELERAKRHASFSTVTKAVQTEWLAKSTEADALSSAVEVRSPTLEVQKAMAQLRPYVGLEISKERTPDKGLRILMVKPDGPAAAAGLVADEHLHSIHDGNRWAALTSHSVFDEKLKSMLPGDTIKAKVYDCGVVRYEHPHTATHKSLTSPRV